MGAVAINWQCTACGQQGSVSIDVRDLAKNETVRPLSEQNGAIATARAAASAAHSTPSPACAGASTGRLLVTFGRAL